MEKNAEQAQAAKDMRERLGYRTQEEFAKALDVSVSTVQKWEIGIRSPSRLAQKLIDALERKRQRARS